jgi:hypothetical protein
MIKKTKKIDFCIALLFGIIPSGIVIALNNFFRKKNKYKKSRVVLIKDR